MNKQKLYELKSLRADAVEAAEKALNEGDQTEYTAHMAEVEELNGRIEQHEALEAQKSKYQRPAPVVIAGEDTATPYEKAVKAFAEAARSRFAVKAVAQGSMLNTENGIDGGYSVPEDIVTRIFELRDAEESLLSEVTIHTVTAKSGRRTLKSRAQHTGFSTVAEAAKYPKLSQPQFTTVEYAIEKRGGYMPATAEVYEYSDGDITRVVEDWMSAEARATANREIAAQVATKASTDLTDLDGILAAWVGLGAAFRSTSKLITNDDGLIWLATLKSEDGAYIMTPNPADPRKLQLCVGPYVLPVKVYSNATLPNNGTKIPMIIGDLKAGIAYWQKKALSIKVSDVAVVGTLNAYEQDLILWRGSIWDDCTTWDTDAFINGYIDTAAAAAEA